VLALKLKEALVLAKEEDWELEIIPTRPPIKIKASQPISPVGCIREAENEWRVVRFIRHSPRKGVFIVVLNREE